MFFKTNVASQDGPAVLADNDLQDRKDDDLPKMTDICEDHQTRTLR